MQYNQNFILLRITNNKKWKKYVIKYKTSYNKKLITIIIIQTIKIMLFNLQIIQNPI